MATIFFEGLFFHTVQNFLPSVYEGAGTFNSFLTTGNPNFMCSFNGYAVDLLPKMSWPLGDSLINNPILREKLKFFYDTNAGFFAIQYSTTHEYELSAPWQAKTYEKLGELILQSLDEKVDALRPENDGVRYALEEVLKHIN